MQECERSGDRLVAADQAVGGIAAEGGQCGAVAEADRGPPRHEDHPRRSAADEQCDVEMPGIDRLPSTEA
jgi:hypothetical protein